MISSVIVLTFISIVSIFYFVSEAVTSHNRQIKTRLERLKPVMPLYDQLDTDLEKPLFFRLFGPIFVKLSGIILKMTPVNIRKQAEHLLELAGYPWHMNVNEFLVIKVLILIGFPFFTFVILSGQSSPFSFLIIVVAFILGMILPDFILKRQASIRQQRITDDLPDSMDLLTVSVEAGLGFDQALLKLVEKTKGPLADEFKRLLQEIRIGKTRRDALRELANRTGVEDLQVFVAAIIQADQLGVSIGNVLRIQSQQLRQKRRMKAEERAQKAPIKMLIPMILFIFPSLFIILLGPGILQLIDNFSKLNK